MKKSILMASALLISACAFAQKKEMKEAGKALDKGQFQQALTLLNQVEAGALADPKLAPEFHFLKAKVFAEKVKKNQDVIASAQNVAKSFADVQLLSKKYTSDIEKIKSEVVNVVLLQGQEAYKVENFKKAAPAFEQVFRLSPRDTSFLYNAAVASIQGKDYDSALKYYTELKELKYDGSEVIFTAKNKETGKIDQFPSKSERDLMVKSGSYVSPKQEKIPSKRGEIIKNIALILIEQGKKEEALKAIADARANNPKDADLIMQEAHIYLQLDNKDKFRELMEEASVLKPNDADIQYNIGVIHLQQNHYPEARKAFEKALQLRPNFSDAALNISTTYINEGNALVEVMNNLGNTKADIKKYNDLKDQKDGLFKKAADGLESYIKTQGKDTNILEQLKNIYGALSDSANFKRIKDML